MRRWQLNICQRTYGGNSGSQGIAHISEVKIENCEDKVIKELTETKKLFKEGFAQMSIAMSNTRKAYKSYPEKFDGSTAKYCLMHSVDSHDIRECSAFKSLDVPSRMEEARRNFVCFCCLKQGHISRRCTNKTACPVKISVNETCGKFHDMDLHLGNTIYSDNNHTSQEKKRENKNVMLMVSTVYSGSSPLSVLWDPGAHLSLISKEGAKKLGMKGKDVTLSITKVGNIIETISSKEYILPLMDKKGTSWYITLYEIEDISAEVGEVDSDRVSTLFENLTTGQLTRPSGKIELLIGSGWCNLMPTKIEENGN